MGATTLAKKIETGTQAKHSGVYAREITRLRHVRAVVSIFFGQGSRNAPPPYRFAKHKN